MEKFLKVSSALLIATLLFCNTSHAQEKSYSIVFLNKKSDADQLPKEKIDSISKGHMQNMERLAAEEKLVAAGPFGGGGGIFIMNSTSRDQVQEWISTDPGIKARRWNVSILPYTPRHGGICPVKPPYEMTNYTLVRFDAVVSKFTASNYPEIMKRHHEHIKKLITSGNVITEAIFGENDGGVIVFKGEVGNELFESDPGVQEGLVDFEIKKLYIAKGSFCEE
jgi:uncharacterized protein YciI